jgi:hypothetical protein
MKRAALTSPAPATLPKMRDLGNVAAAPLPRVAHLSAVPRQPSRTENGKVVPPRRVPNRERRTREHLTPAEVDLPSNGRRGERGGGAYRTPPPIA